MRVHKHAILSAQPAIDTSIYASGDRLGSLVTIPNAVPDTKGKAKIISVTVQDKSKQNAAFDILIFNDVPTIASADNAAIDIADSELSKLEAVIPILTSDYTTVWANNSQATKVNINLIVSAKADSKNLYVLLVSRGAPTYGAASDLLIKFGVEIV